MLSSKYPFLNPIPPEVLLIFDQKFLWGTIFSTFVLVFMCVVKVLSKYLMLILLNQI